MISRKDLIVAILCTFCLTMVLFSTMPVKSAGVYDPWIDVNHDGKINVLDLIKIVPGLTSSGDPALNVTVANWPNATDTLVWFNAQINNTSPKTSPATYNAKGFAHLNVLVSTGSLVGYNNLNITLYGVIWNPTHTLDHSVVAYRLSLNSNQYGVAFSTSVPSQTFYFLAVTNSATNVQLSLSYYATWG